MKRIGNIFLLLALLLLGAMVTVSVVKGVRFDWFTRDPSAIAGVHPLAGFLSNLGILLWCATAAVCFFASLVLAREPKRDARAAFLLVAGTFTTVLLFDDFFQLHERLLPIYLGLSEHLLYAIYVVLTLVMVVGFRRLILSTDYRYLAVALFLFVVSLVADVFIAEMTLERYLLEDGAKFVAIVSWFSYFGRLAELAVTQQRA